MPSPLVQVSIVQREFVEKLLTKPVFQRHMTAVREVLNMLRAAQKIRSNGELYDDQAIKARTPLDGIWAIVARLKRLMTSGE